MSLPNGGGGYQVGDGNVDRVVLGIQPEPAFIFGSASLTVAQLLTGAVVCFPGGAPMICTLPDIAAMDAAITGAKTRSFFDLFVTNADGTNTVTLTGGTGWEILGNNVVAAGTPGLNAWFRVVKNGTADWSPFRLF